MIRRWNIVVAEDSTDIRNVLVRLLERNGYDVAAVSNGRDALHLIRARLPDLVMLDLSMPVQDGWETLTAIRSLPGGEYVPVIAITAHAMIGDREAVLDHGFDAYISKPFDMRTFLSIVTQMIGQ